MISHTSTILDRLHFICDELEISISELAQKAQVDPEIFNHYDTGELRMDEDTLQRILALDEKIDWLWLLEGYMADPVYEQFERLGIEYRC